MNKGLNKKALCWIECLLVFFIFAWMQPASFAADDTIETSIGALGQKEAIRDRAVEMLNVGMGEYKNALFESAEQSLLKAQKYKAYLSEQQQLKLSKYLKSTEESAVLRKGALEHIQTADKLVKEGELIKAKAHLEAVSHSGLITPREQKLVKDGLKKIDIWLKSQEKQMKALYQRSVELFNAGQLENARAGFIKAAKSGLVSAREGCTPEDYINKIDTALGKADSGALGAAITDAELYARQAMVNTGSWTRSEGILGGGDAEKLKKSIRAEGKSMEELRFRAKSQKMQIAQGYVKAVVAAALKRGRNYLIIDKFYQAQKELENARIVLIENRLYLDDNMYDEYDNSLKQMEDEIKAGRSKMLGPLNTE